MINYTSNDLRRFWNKVALPNLIGVDDCWIWLASCNQNGYGQFGIKGRLYQSHRLAWMFIYGDIPTDKVILHFCDNPKCVNPSHLQLGTQLENIQDRQNKKRQHHPIGEKNPRVKLTPEDVIKIRAMQISLSSIAKMFNISTTHVRYIRNKKSWKHITDSVLPTDEETPEA